MGAIPNYFFMVKYMVEINLCEELAYVCSEYFCKIDKDNNNMHSSWQPVCKKCKRINKVVKEMCI